MRNDTSLQMLQSIYVCVDLFKVLVTRSVGPKVIDLVIPTLGTRIKFGIKLIHGRVTKGTRYQLNMCENCHPTPRMRQYEDLTPISVSGTFRSYTRVATHQRSVPKFN